MNKLLGNVVYRSALLILLVPLALVGYWHICNQAWPSDDAANYMSTAYQEYQEFSRAGFWRGLQGLYLIRGWRPVLLAPLAVPFLGFTRGNVVTAAAATLSLAYLGVLVYVYAIARTYLNRSAAVAATVALVSLPSFATYALVFNTEVFWLFTSFGWLYHNLTADYLRRRLHACLAAAYLGLAVMIRPAETFIIMVLPIGFFLLGAVRHVTSDRRELVLGLGLLAAIGSALILSAFITDLTRDVLLISGGVVIAAWALLLHHRRRPNGVSLFCIILSAGSLAWWSGFMPALYSWVYTTSFGDMAHLLPYGNSTEGNSSNLIEEIATVLWAPVSTYAGIQVDILVGLAAALTLNRVLLARAGTSKPSSGPPSRSTRVLGIVALGMSAPMAVLYALSGANDPRRIIISVAVAILLATILSVRQGPLARVRLAVVMLLSGINLYGLLVATVPGVPLSVSVAERFRLYLPAAHHTPDANPKLIDELAHLGVHQQDYVAVYTLALFQSSARVYEPAALELAALVNGQIAGIGYLWDEGDYSGVLSRLYGMGYRYLVLDLYDGPGARHIHNPYTQFTTALLDRYAEGAGATPGLERVQVFQLGGRDHVLFHILPRAAN